MKITQDVRDYAAAQEAEKEAQEGMEQKSKEFLEQGAEVYKTV